ncbi:squalene synthase [Aplysia californica]|uniref:Squalene synthase n=1 Tax=Aplysia californica TaxID=6500 RepID=A0ABM0JJE2_APLCA|nr:squalene synthase [Aplysia californica]XP_005095011.1 squalene synthase [Aplysia californica]
MMDLLKSFSHPEEVMALLRFKFGGCEVVMPKCDFNSMSPSLKTCYDLLNKTSRSFAAVIQALDGELRNAVCIFYLVLRALDTVEDDMTIPLDRKVPMLDSFYKNLEDPHWKYMESNDKDRIVLEQFPCISKEFRELAEVYRKLISEICQKMGHGMTVFLERKVDTMEEWDEYCYYVAGLVGIGLAGLFSASGLEDPIVGQDSKLANQVGLFLQKTNIIRDYLEDWNDQRIFWPKAAWSKYAGDIGDFAQPENRERALECLNDLITNAMELVPASMLFMSRLQNQTIFNFVAIPQVMAIATLERCYNNPKVFTGVVKIRKGEAVRMMMGATSFDKVKAIMRHFTLEIMERIPEKDPNASKMQAVCQKALQVTETSQEYSTSSIYPPLYVSMGLMVSAIAYTYWSQVSQWYSDLL